MLDRISNGDPNGVRADAGPRQADQKTVLRGQVVIVNDVSGAQIMVNGKAVSAAQATDEPLRAGDFVWVVRTNDDQYVVLGSVKG